jgi:hypothetical protein
MNMPSQRSTQASPRHTELAPRHDTYWGVTQEWKKDNTDWDIKHSLEKQSMLNSKSCKVGPSSLSFSGLRLELGLGLRLELGLELGPLMGSSYLVRHSVVVVHTESVPPA